MILNKLKKNKSNIEQKKRAHQAFLEQSQKQNFKTAVYKALEKKKSLDSVILENEKKAKLLQKTRSFLIISALFAVLFAQAFFAYRYLNPSKPKSNVNRENIEELSPEQSPKELERIICALQNNSYTAQELVQNLFHKNLPPRMLMRSIAKIANIRQTKLEQEKIEFDKRHSLYLIQLQCKSSDSSNFTVKAAKINNEYRIVEIF